MGLFHRGMQIKKKWYGWQLDTSLDNHTTFTGWKPHWQCAIVNNIVFQKFAYPCETRLSGSMGDLRLHYQFEFC